MKISPVGFLAVLIGLAWTNLFSQSDVSRHPGLFFKWDGIQGIQENIDADENLAAIAAAIVGRANDFLDTPTNPYVLTSEFNGMGTAGRALQSRVGFLAFSGLLTGEKRYTNKAIEILLAVAEQSEPDEEAAWQTHLQYADAAQAFAIGYDWLYPSMTDEERKSISAEVWKFGHLLFTDDVAWGKPDPSVSSCNHNAVHFGALGLCALVLGDHQEWLDRAIERQRAYLRYSMDATGYLTEGHSYMNYGLLGLLPFAYALERSGGPDLLAEQPAFQRVGEQLIWKWIPGTTNFLPMNDNETHMGAAGMITGPIFRYSQAVLWGLWLDVHGESGHADYGTGIGGSLYDGLSAPFVLIWGKAGLEPVSPREADWPLSVQYESGRVFARDQWDSSQAAHFSFTSGYDFHRGHNHQDENALTFHALGEAFLIDPGYWFKDSRSHNTLVIDGADQIPSSRGRIVAFAENGASVFVRGQAPEAYDWNQALVGHYDRKALFVREPFPFVIWRDDAQVENHGEVLFVQNLVTDPANKVKIDENGFTITGSKGLANCRIFVSALGGDVDFSIPDLENSLSVRSRGKTSRKGAMIQLQATVKALNPVFTVVVIPYRMSESAPEVSFDSENGQLFVRSRHLGVKLSYLVTDLGIVPANDVSSR